MGIILMFYNAQQGLSAARHIIHNNKAGRTLSRRLQIVKTDQMLQSAVLVYEEAAEHSVQLLSDASCQ